MGFPVFGIEKEGILRRENSSQSRECATLMVTPTALRKQNTILPLSFPGFSGNEQLDELHQEAMF